MAVDNTGFTQFDSNQNQSVEKSYVAYKQSMGDNVDRNKVYLFNLNDSIHLVDDYEWIIENVLGVGETFLIVGQSSAGKSTLALNMLLQLLTPGEKFLETYPIVEENRPKCALIVQAENTFSGENKRIKDMIKQRPQYANSIPKINTLSFQALNWGAKNVHFQSLENI